ncbi:hypothetical protein HZB08_01000, partial [Candidatus Saganbacteria bacterium]|nr:hypothetical protein [Candidatus Saganbacteria bacterium]
AVVLPRYVDLTIKSKENAAKASLGGIRAAVSIRYGSNAAYGNASFSDSLYTSLFADSRVPVEPYSDSSSVQVVSSSPPATTGTGWRYASDTGQVWINNSNYSGY